MRVKRLEIQGFKSFKDKTVIHFDHGITGIVGPNGCGKSNIVDAFFWVMGEQSYKHMRGSSSEDLIFNGSSKYSPMGLAEATMVLETGYDGGTEEPAAGATTQDIPIHLRTKEIAVTRRVYRTGEGEYFINGVQARLKDIHELFMDTGVGAKGYSVIEQGQIGKIVNAKPEDRRLLIEEAAGIAKYKARKKESLRKMEATTENLSRLTDVIQEIERNLNSLERQAQKARSYKKLKEELLDKEMTWGRRKAKLISERLEALKLEKETLEQDLAGMKAELQTFENTSEVDRVEQLTDTKQAEEVQARIQQFSNQLTQERSALDLSQRRQTDLTHQVESLEQERADLITSVEGEQTRLSEREQEVAGADEFFRTAAQKAQSMDEAVRKLRQATEAARRELDGAKASLLAGITQASELSSRSAVLTSRIESGRAQTDRLREQARLQTERTEESDLEVTRHRAEVATLVARGEELASEKGVQSARVQETRDELRAAESERDQANRAFTQTRSRLTSLEELADAYEGFADGPKAALEWARAHEQTLTVLADAFDVTPGYEPVLESLLEDRLESLFSEQPGSALEAISELRASKSGRVSVGITEGRLAETPVAPTLSYEEAATLLTQAGLVVQGRLAEFVKPTAGAGALAERAATQLITHVIAVESLTPSAAAAITHTGGWSVVGQDGIVFDAETGALRGGSAAKDAAASVLRRKRAIAELREQTEAAEARFTKSETSAAELKEALEIATAKLQETQAELQEVAVSRAGRERDLHQGERALKEASAQLERTESELERLATESEQASAQRQELEAKLTALVGSRQEIEGQINESDAAIQSRDAEVRTQENELNALRVEEASLRERAGSLKREAESARALIADRHRRVSEISRILERLSEERAQFTGGESALIERIEVLTRQLAENRDELAQVKDRLEQVSARLHTAHDRVKQLHKAVDQQTARSTQLAIEGEKLSSEIAHLTQNLEEKYGPGCLERPETAPVQEEMTAPVVTVEMSAEEEALLGEEVERLRDRIRRLGEVNTGAIEEFEDVKKRFDHLLTERADLERSIENLKDAIEHINKTSEDRFRRAFEAIADRFERLFPIIFGGGQAKLSLVYPEGSADILEAGVDILAQPPGKKIVNITLLSGGEKALTAVSLIFAIFMVKPSPFCVLDEVDAPLDDANIGKFNALLREMSAKSQFILITHNKKTMELNDTLYGVTMEEPGVSKMVSIEMH